MSLNNPVSAIKETFIHLNEKRIANLTSKRSKQVSGTEFCIGQFVLLTDELNVKAEARAKLSIPNRSRLYKIVALNKDGFTATILDVLSGSRKEVLTSRLCNLDLHTLEMFNFSSPTFYKNLQRLTDMVRRKYVPPRRVPPPGLHLLSPGDDVLREDHGIHVNDDVDPEDNVTDDGNNITVITDDDRDNSHTMYTTNDGSNNKHGVTVDLPRRSNGHASGPTNEDGHLEENGKEGGDGAEEEGEIHVQPVPSNYFEK